MTGAEGEVVLSAKDAARLTAAFEPPVGRHLEVSAAGMRLLLVNQKRLEVDLAAARIEGAERALLERDVAEVEFRIRFEADEVVSLQGASAWDYLQARTWSEHTGRLYLSSASDFQRAGSYRSDEARERYAQLADCQAWLARARAVLG